MGSSNNGGELEISAEDLPYLKMAVERIKQEAQEQGGFDKHLDGTDSNVVRYMAQPDVNAPEEVRQKNWHAHSKNVPLGNFNEKDERLLMLKHLKAKIWYEMMTPRRSQTFSECADDARTDFALKVGITRGRNGFFQRSLNTNINETIAAGGQQGGRASFVQRLFGKGGS